MATRAWYKIEFLQALLVLQDKEMLTVFELVLDCALKMTVNTVVPYFQTLLFYAASIAKNIFWNLFG
jgi:hypothetical protein